MDKLVKIILLIIGLSLLFLWLSKSFDSCNSADGNGDDIALEAEQEIPKEELFEADEIDYTTTKEDDEAIPEEIIEDDSETSGNNTIDFTTPPPVKTKTTSNTSSTKAASSTGEYMIIAGNYLLKSNAELMVIKLKGLGQDDASIGRFDDSQYHTVIAGRYKDYHTASNSVQSLKRRGIDCYVKRKS